MRKSHIVAQDDTVQANLKVNPSVAKAGELQIWRCQGFAADDYGFTPAALALKRSSFRPIDIRSIVIVQIPWRTSEVQAVFFLPQVVVNIHELQKTQKPLASWQGTDGMAGGVEHLIRGCGLPVADCTRDGQFGDRQIRWVDVPKAKSLHQHVVLNSQSLSNFMVEIFPMQTGTIELETAPAGDQEWKSGERPTALAIRPSKGYRLLSGPSVYKRCQVSMVAGGMERIPTQGIRNNDQQIIVFRQT